MFKDHVTRVTTIVYLFFHRDGFQPAIRISKRLSRYFPHPCFLPFRKTDPRRVYLIGSPFRSFSSKGESVSRIFRRVIDPIFYDLTKYYEIYIYIYIYNDLLKNRQSRKERERKKKKVGTKIRDSILIKKVLGRAITIPYSTKTSSDDKLHA